METLLLLAFLSASSSQPATVDPAWETEIVTRDVPHCPEGYKLQVYHEPPHVTLEYTGLVPMTGWTDVVSLKTRPQTQGPHEGDKRCARE